MFSEKHGRLMPFTEKQEITLKSGDLLDAPEWDPRSKFGNNGSQHDPRYFMMALDLACFVSNSHIR